MVQCIGIRERHAVKTTACVNYIVRSPIPLRIMVYEPKPAIEKPVSHKPK